jgi:hypothetical protein
VIGKKVCNSDRLCAGIIPASSALFPNARDTYLSIPGSIRPACAPTRHPELPTSQKKDESGAESHKRGIPTTNKAVYRFWGVTVLSPYVIGSGTVLSARGTSSLAGEATVLTKAADDEKSADEEAEGDQQQRVGNADEGQRSV